MQVINQKTLTIGLLEMCYAAGQDKLKINSCFGNWN